MEKLGHFLFKYRNNIFPIIFISLFIFFRPHLALGDIRGDMIFDTLGVIIMLAGLALRAMVIGYAYIRRGGVNKEVYADNLVTEGVFSLCRNPLYVGNILMVLGFLVIFHNPWTYLIGTLTALLSYKAIVTAEESYLIKKFGVEYKAYCKNVPRWSFRLEDARKNLARYKFSWSRVVLKDYSTAYSSIISIFGTLVYERLVIREYAHSILDFKTISLTFIIITIAFLIVYILKKRHILVAHDLITPG